MDENFLHAYLKYQMKELKHRNTTISKNFRLFKWFMNWATKKGYNENLVELGKENKRIVVLEADLGKSTMSYLFQQAFPEKYFEMGIVEQNMTSFAAGLSLAGKIAFTNSFAVFSAGRSYDQIR